MVDINNAYHYYRGSVIKSFADRETLEFWEGGYAKRIPANLRQTAKRKLAALDAAVKLADLASPPGNRLEALKGDRAGQHSIRINQRYRICFIWHATDAYEVEIVDYH